MTCACSNVLSLSIEFDPIFIGALVEHLVSRGAVICWFVRFPCPGRSAVAERYSMQFA